MLFLGGLSITFDFTQTCFHPICRPRFVNFHAPWIFIKPSQATTSRAQFETKKFFKIFGHILKIDLANRILITYFMGARLQ